MTQFLLSALYENILTRKSLRKKQVVTCFNLCHFLNYRAFAISNCQCIRYILKNQLFENIIKLTVQQYILHVFTLPRLKQLSLSRLFALFINEVETFCVRAPSLDLRGLSRPFMSITKGQVGRLLCFHPCYRQFFPTGLLA